MKHILFLSMAFAALLQGTLAHAQTTPPFAASTKTWTLGNQTWSDAIHMPKCNKVGFEKSYDTPQCRSYTLGTVTWYYYNWPYVNQYASTLCPAPWRVPTNKDFVSLEDSTNGYALAAHWGYGGADDGSSEHKATRSAFYWSLTAHSDDPTAAFAIIYAGPALRRLFTNKYYMMQVRCVK